MRGRDHLAVFILLAIAGVGLCIPGSAQASSSRCVDQLNPRVRFSGVEDPGARAQTLNTVARLRQFLGKRFQWPESFGVELLPPGDWADAFEGRVRVPVLFGSARSTEIVLVHELAHLVFRQTLSLLIPDIIARYDELGSMDSKEAKEELRKLRVVLVPYSELFSDVAVVAYFNAGKAPAEPLTDGEDSEFRDFTHSHELKGWDLEGPYALLSPTRSWLWQAHFARSANAKERSTLAESVLRGIADQVRERFNEKTEPAPEQINRDLIKAITARAKESPRGSRAARSEAPDRKGLE
jgi:hypothetical protein